MSILDIIFLIVLPGIMIFVVGYSVGLTHTFYVFNKSRYKDLDLISKNIRIIPNRINKKYNL
jgi:hypothetical protein